MRFSIPDRDAVARSLFFLSLLMLAFAYGVGATQYALFPVPQIKNAKEAAQQLLQETGASLPWYYQRSRETAAVDVRNPHAVAPGLRLINGLAADEKTLVKVVDVDGRMIHSWRIDWFKIWPKPDHLAADLIPKSNAGLVHGLVVASNGDLIFNFEQLGMVRMNACGEVVWKLPYRTHHTLHLDENGNLWAPGVITRHEAQSRLPNYAPPFDDYTILEVSPGGKILRELPVADLLLENNLKGLLYMSSTRNRSTKVTDDTLHLNDVETFPSSLEPGTFTRGDVLISLRNINTILVFDPTSRRIKYLSVGAVLRQHDADFIDGNTISVFDNNNLAVWGEETTPDPAGHHSRVVRLSTLNDRVDVRFSGTDKQPFFTDIMGNQQLLPNGNTLLTESIAGRVIEVDEKGNIVWEYVNFIGNGLVAVVADAMMLSREFDQAFFERAVSACRKKSES